jgi:osmotically-inducible protein OsmY
MPKRLSLLTFALTGSLFFMANAIQAEQSTNTLAENSALDNTQRNLRDKDNLTLTAEDQKESKADLNITAHIRKGVHKDKSLSLSMDAHNAKIITRNGVVTLRGPVETEAERLKLQQITQKTKGVLQIDNQLEIKAP